MTQPIPVVIPAAGVGRRMQADRPKQYLKLLDKTLLEHTLHNLSSHPLIGDIFLVLSADDGYFDALHNIDLTRITRVDGGDERVNSVLAGLNAVAQASPETEWVMVHDAARPCVTHQDIDRLLESRETFTDGAILATPVRDTMKQSCDGELSTITHTVPREHLWHALTPQLFRTQSLISAIEQGLDANAHITDEASAMEMLGKAVGLVTGSVSNLKVTTPDDLALAEFYLSRGESCA